MKKSVTRALRLTYGHVGVPDNCSLAIQVYPCDRAQNMCSDSAKTSVLLDSQPLCTPAHCTTQRLQKCNANAKPWRAPWHACGPAWQPP